MNTLVPVAPPFAIHNSKPNSRSARWNRPLLRSFWVLLLLTMVLVAWTRRPSERVEAGSKTRSALSKTGTEQQYRPLRPNRRLSLNFSGPTVRMLRPNSCAPYSMSVALHAIDNPVSYEQVCREVEFADEGVPFERIVSCLRRHALAIPHRGLLLTGSLLILIPGDRPLSSSTLRKFSTWSPASVIRQTARGAFNHGSYATVKRSVVTATADGNCPTRNSAGAPTIATHNLIPSIAAPPTIDCWLAVSSNPLETGILDRIRQLSSSPSASLGKTHRKPASILDLLREHKK